MRFKAKRNIVKVRALAMDLAKVTIGTLIMALGILNAPLFLIAFFRVGKEFFIKAIAGTVLLSVFLNAFENMKPATTDRFLAFIYGSIIVGIGTAIVLKANGSTGGTDLLANIIKSYKPHLKTGTLIVITDAIIVAANTLYFKDIEIALYSALFRRCKLLQNATYNFSKMGRNISRIKHRDWKRNYITLWRRHVYKKRQESIIMCNGTF